MSTEPDPAVSSLTRALRGYLDARSAAVTEARKVLGIGELDARALLFLAENPGTRPSVLRGYLGITSAGVTVLTDRLVERGIIARRSDPDDRRASRLYSTIDLGVAPWDALTAFDTELEKAIREAEPTASENAASLISALMTTRRVDVAPEVR